MTHRSGEQSRRQKRLSHMEAVKKKSRQLLEKEFPNPAKPPTEHSFFVGWERYCQSLMDTFGQQKDFRLAFNHGINQIVKNQREHGWALSPPSHLITNKIPTQLRSPQWLKSAWAFYDAHQQWLDAKENESGDNQLRIQQRFQCLMLSLLCDSGQCNIDILSSFHQLLKSNTALPLKRFGNCAFVTLTLDNDKLNSNSYQDDEPVTIYHCYLSLRTLGHLKQWQKLDKTTWQCPGDTKALFSTLTAQFPKHKHLPTTLSGLCSCTAFWYERHSNHSISEALLEYRVGRTRSYSLPTTNLIRIIAPTLQAVSSTSFHQFSTSVTASQTRKSLHGTNGMSLKPNQFIREIKSACKPNQNGMKVSSQTVRKNLETLLSAYQYQLWQQLFIRWLIYKSQGCSAKTVHQYMLNQVKYWCLMNTEQNLASADSSTEVEEIYQEQINRHQTAKSQHYYANRLKELHAFAKPEMGLPSLSNSFFHIDSGKKHTRAGLIDEPLFKALLQHIDSLTDLNKTDKLALQTICIIAYRTGLRINELYKLQLGNLENSATGWLEIRSNRFGDNKTASGMRKVPVYPLLLEHEHHIVSNYLRYRKGQTQASTAPLLIMGKDTHRPFDTFAVSNYVGKVLRVLSGQKQEHLVFYHLRHSCFSRLQLILEHHLPHTVLPAFYPYSLEQTEKIRQTLFKSSLSNGYWEIAAFAGHESPQATFGHYFHLSDLLAAPTVDEIETVIKQDEAIQRGLCSRRQYQSIKKENGEVTLGDISNLLYKSLKISDLATAPETISVESIQLALPNEQLISIDVCYQVLEAISKGEQIDTLAFRYHLKQSTIDKWLANATYLKTLTIGADEVPITNSHVEQNEITDAKPSRLFSPQRAHALVPGNLGTIEEIKYADEIILRLRDHYKHNTGDINEMMLYALKHTYVYQSGITFSSPATFDNFIKTFQFAIPKSHWRAVKLCINSSIIKYEWQLVLKGMKTTEEKRGTKTVRSGKGSVRLELISPSEKRYTKQGKVNKYSSHLLIFLMYMSFVMLRKA